MWSMVVQRVNTKKEKLLKNCSSIKETQKGKTTQKLVIDQRGYLGQGQWKVGVFDLYKLR